MAKSGAPTIAHDPCALTAHDCKASLSMYTLAAEGDNCKGGEMVAEPVGCLPRDFEPILAVGSHDVGCVVKDSDSESCDRQNQDR